MHCCSCGTTSTESRPVNVSMRDLDALIALAGVRVPAGDVYVCQKCANRMAGVCVDSVFATWVGFPCDRCHKLAAFNDAIDDLPTGIVCDDCSIPNDPNVEFGDSARGMWLCDGCFEHSHQGHREKLLQPILDRLSKI